MQKYISHAEKVLIALMKDSKKISKFFFAFVRLEIVCDFIFEAKAVSNDIEH